MKVYLKMRNNTWMLINTRIEQTISKKKQNTRYILAGEQVDRPPLIQNSIQISIPASIVNKVISSLLDVKSNDHVIIEPLGIDKYIVKVDERNRSVVEEVLKRLFH